MYRDTRVSEACACAFVVPDCSATNSDIASFFVHAYKTNTRSSQYFLMFSELAWLRCSGPLFLFF
jgi:hypothetical protein